MDLDLLKKENIVREKLKEKIEAAGEQPSTDKISKLLEQVCAIVVDDNHLFDDITFLKEALNLVNGPNTRDLIRGTIRSFILNRVLDQEVPTPKIVSQPNRLGAALNPTDNNAELSKSKAILCTGILIGTIFGGFILKCLCFLLFMAAMIAMFWIFGSMHKSQGLR